MVGLVPVVQARCLRSGPFDLDLVLEVLGRLLLLALEADLSLHSTMYQVGVAGSLTTGLGPECSFLGSLLAVLVFVPAVLLPCGSVAVEVSQSRVGTVLVVVVLLPCLPE